MSRLSPVAALIFGHVKEALQEADELGGPEGEDYLALMRAVSGHCHERARAFASYVLEDQGLYIADLEAFIAHNEFDQEVLFDGSTTGGAAPSWFLKRRR